MLKPIAVPTANTSAMVRTNESTTTGMHRPTHRIPT
jgi:hypothetical protein